MRRAKDIGVVVGEGQQVADKLQCQYQSRTLYGDNSQPLEQQHSHQQCKEGAQLAMAKRKQSSHDGYQPRG